MNFFKRREVENDLTRNINEYSLEQVLTHKDLSNSIRNESEKLYNRILDSKDQWFLQIIQYALFNKEAPPDFQHLNNINQINHNAANFLECCGKKFAKL